MIDSLIHVYRKDTVPFRTLSGLPDDEALQIMQDLYVAGSVFWERFQEPAQYLQLRRQVEAWLFQAFIAKGGTPRTRHPLYMVFGRSRWIQTALDPATRATTTEIQVPISLFRDADISFTVPDSMIAFLLAQQEETGIVLPEFYGRLFTLAEICLIVEAHGLPGEKWGTNLPATVPNYIEAQIWNSDGLSEYVQQLPLPISTG
jgi:hypothetical protein